MTTVTEREFITTPVAAERLGVRPVDIYELIDAGRLTLHRSERRTALVDAAEVDALRSSI